MSGDLEAPAVLSNYYENDLAKLTFWRAIGAQNGGSFNQVMYAAMLGSYGGQYGQSTIAVYNNIRAYFWAKLALQHPDKVWIANLAISLLSVNQASIYHWDDVSWFYRSDKWIAEVARRLEHGNSSIITNINGFHFQACFTLLQDVDRADGPYEKLNVGTSNIGALRINALFGDTNAADVVVKYYEKRGGESDIVYWQTIAAEDGDLSSQKFLATNFMAHPSEDNRQRAIFWERHILESEVDPISMGRF